MPEHYRPSAAAQTAAVNRNGVALRLACACNRATLCPNHEKTRSCTSYRSSRVIDAKSCWSIESARRGLIRPCSSLSTRSCCAADTPMPLNSVSQCNSVSFEMSCFRTTSHAFAPTLFSRRTPIIRFSVKQARFMPPFSQGSGPQQQPGKVLTNRSYERQNVGERHGRSPGGV